MMNDDKTKKIPDHARVAFKGVIHEIWQWEQEMFDGTFSLYEVVKRKNTVTILAVTTDKKIIVNYEQQPHRGKFIAISGGIAEDYGSDLDNAKRELEEETGFVSESWELFMKYDVLGNRKIEWFDLFYIARDCKKTGKIKLDPGEKIETKLFGFNEFIEIIQHPEFRNRNLKDLIKLKGVEEFRKYLFGE